MGTSSPITVAESLGRWYRSSRNRRHLTRWRRFMPSPCAGSSDGGPILAIAGQIDHCRNTLNESTAWVLFGSNSTAL
jgi:hypothetical protein